MTDTYLKVLQHLEPFGIDREVDISDDLVRWLRGEPVAELEEHIDSLNSRLVHLVDEMSENKHIRLFREPVVVNDENRWHVIVRLTFDGKLYCITERQILLDRAIATNSIKQTTIFRWTAAFACGAMIIAALSILRDIHKDNLSQQVKERDSLIHTLQKSLYHLKTDSSHQKEAKKLRPKISFFLVPFDI